MGKRGKKRRSGVRAVAPLAPAESATVESKSYQGVIVAACIIAAAIAIYFIARPGPDSPDEIAQSVGSTDSGYVDSSACAGCHPAIAETYSRTGMGRSYFRPVADRILGDFSSREPFYHELSDRYYVMREREGRYFQQRYQLDGSGKQSNIVEKEIDYVMGSGNHARTYLSRATDGRLMQLPLGWYEENGGFWAMNPGYDQPQHKGFEREISFDCIFCHNGYPEITPGEDLAGRDPRLPERLPQGIDCQRCHGPGRAHLDAAGSSKPVEEIRAAILNPGRLSSERQMEVCMQCHLETTSNRLPHAIRRFDRGAFSYRPGEPLADYMLHFDTAPGSGDDDRFEIAHAAYRLRKSACFIATGETASPMTCTTCHDPHDTSRDGELERVNSICRNCHEPTLATLVAGGSHPASNDCGSCHMPKRRTDDVVHVVMTDHYIQRHLPKGDLTAPKQETQEKPESEYKGEVVPYYPAGPPSTQTDQLYVAVAQIMEGSNLEAGIDRLAVLLGELEPEEAEFYFHLAEAYWNTGRAKRAGEMYEQALERSPGHVVALRNYGATLIESGEFARAAEVLERGCNEAEGDARCFSNLGEALTRLGRHGAASEALGRAVRLDPDLPEAHANLASAYSGGGDRGRAVASAREAIRLRPDFYAAHNTLANLLVEQGQDAEAERHYKLAVAAGSQYAEAHYNYGSWLIGRRRTSEAERMLTRAVQLRPKFAEAHNNLGNLLAMGGRVSDGIRHFELAIESDAQYADAHMNLGTALASMGEIDSAMQSVRNALKINPDNPKSNLNLVLTCVSYNNYEINREG